MTFYLIRSRILIHYSQVWIRGPGSGSVPNCHGSATMILTIRISLFTSENAISVTDPGCLSRIPDLYPSRIPDLIPFFGSHKLDKIENYFSLQC
jgi:hypothetical protein